MDRTSCKLELQFYELITEFLSKESSNRTFGNDNISQNLHNETLVLGEKINHDRQQAINILLVK